MRAAYLTAFRALAPWRFWAIVTTTVPASPARLAVWLALILIPAYGALLGCQMLWQWMLEGTLLPADAGSRMEFFAPMLYDMGETTPAGGSAPLWFPNRLVPGMAVGGILPALMLLALVRTRAAAGIRGVHLARVAVYAQLPLLSTLFWQTFGTLVAINSTWPGPIRIGKSFYFWTDVIARTEECLLVVWLALWWYFAVARGLEPGHRRFLGAACALVAILTAAIFELGDWRQWYFRFGVP